MDNLNSATKATTTDTLANPPFITTDSTRLTGKFNIFAPKLAELIKVTGTMVSLSPLSKHSQTQHSSEVSKE